MSEKEKKKFAKVTTPYFRVSFPHVFKAHSAFKDQDPAYSLQMLFPKSADLTEMKEAVKRVLKEKWPDKEKRPKDLRSPFRDGDEKDLDEYKGMTYVNAKSKMRPGIVDKDRQEIIDPQEFYAGCWARATLSVYAYDFAGNRGAGFGLQNLQFVKDDKSFSGKKNAKDDFEMIDSFEDEDKSEDIDDDDF